MRLSEVKLNAEYYHQRFGLVTAIRKRAGIYVIVRRNDIAANYDDDDEDDEDDEDPEVEVRPDTLIPKSQMTPELKAALKIKMDKKARKEKEEKERLDRWMDLEARLPEIPSAVREHLKKACQNGLMAFFKMINTDPDALEKLKQHSHFLLRKEIEKLETTVPALEQDLDTKKKILELSRRYMERPTSQLPDAPEVPTLQLSDNTERALRRIKIKRRITAM